MLFLRDGAPGQLKRRHAVQAASWGVHTDNGEPARGGTSIRRLYGNEMLSAPALALTGVESRLCNVMLFLRDGAPGQFRLRHAVQAASIGVHTAIGEPAGGTPQQAGGGSGRKTSSGLRAATPGSINGRCCLVAVTPEEAISKRAPKSAEMGCWGR
mmetsp:Transcript_112562/g.223746  ORF Transcript_112562/g.223746 Transcript_112562/m.223746 type:complete len:156 (+) Transcript_112562:501-968(+)